MGGDNAPDAVIKGALNALHNNTNLDIILVGKSKIIKDKLNTYNKNNIERIAIMDAPEVIDMGEKPLKALRKKKKSSIYIGSKLVKEKKADAFISAGSTGAVMASGLLNIGRIKEIKRPSIATIFPSSSGKTLVMDAGANVDSKPVNLQQFAVMGQIYANKMFNIENPRVGLLNIGEEEKKGNKLTTEAYQLLKKDNRLENFIGNIEGRDIFNGTCDVVICDGFIGNVVLKTTEGIASYLLHLFKNAFKENIITKIAGLMVKPYLKKIKEKVDYRQYGGAPLLGVNGVVIISHGSSDDFAIENAISVAIDTDEKNIVKIIKEKKKTNREGEANG